MYQTNIVVRGARQHNLQNIDVTIPRNTLSVITGVSGSGKSSLAFNTIYAEGQRRYVESLSAYARQFLGLMEKPDVDHIEGLSPAISIDQKGVSKNPRSTVGTVTEIYDYLRLMFARIGHPHCPKCHKTVSRQTVQQIVDEVLDLPSGLRAMVLAPVVTHTKGEHRAVFESALANGFVRARVDGKILNLEDKISLDKNKWHNIQIVVDRIIISNSADKGRITDSIETALKFGKGNITILAIDNNHEKEILFSERFACTDCNISLTDLQPRNFSFNTPYGACPSCTGLGYRMEVDPTLIVKDTSLTLRKGAIDPWQSAGAMSTWYSSTLESLAKSFEFSMDTPFKDLSKEIQQIILYGKSNSQFEMAHTTKKGHIYKWQTKFEGVIKNLERRYTETESQPVRENIEQYMSQRKCTNCKGDRLRQDALAVTVRDINIIQLTRKTVQDLIEWIKEGSNNISVREYSIAQQILNEIESRLSFLQKVGLNYISLDRSAGTLSGGEGQRIRLATQIGSGLTGVLYVCDEPSVGLHPADNFRLIETLKSLRDVGNTVLIVEHDETVMRASDHIVDLGPGAGIYGGQIVAQGTVAEVSASTNSVTGAYLDKRKIISVRNDRRCGDKGSITVVGANANNLKNIDVSFPLGCLICVTGVSGSGKSTLVNQVLSNALVKHFYKSMKNVKNYKKIEGLEGIDKFININQTPIGRTPRSNPATYTGTFTPIRELFASTEEAKARGYVPGRFSFNVKGGRCESCTGAGYVQIEMQFLPDITVPCESCKGARYNREALEITFKGYSIAEVLNITITEALVLFENIPYISRKLSTLNDVGLGYLRLGQPSTTLSGGEAQRIKLAAELSRRSTGRTLYTLDEPTTGLSFDDCEKLIQVLHRLVDAGNTVILIEHHLDFIKNADWIIDLGPEAGDKGGEIIATGTPEQIALIKESATGRYLNNLTDINSR